MLYNTWTIYGQNRKMKEFLLERTSRVERPLPEVFDFFASAENLERLTPPELGFQITSRLPIEMRRGALIDYTIKLYGIPMKWRTEITQWNPTHSFEDTQLKGPYAKWVHTHTFTPDGDATIIHDRVVYGLPLGLLGRIAHPVIAYQLKNIFNFRESVLAEIFA